MKIRPAGFARVRPLSVFDRHKCRRNVQLFFHPSPRDELMIENMYIASARARMRSCCLKLGNSMRVCDRGTDPELI